MIRDFLIPFVAVGLAELGDKTQVSLILISSKTQDHTRLLGGVLLGFLLVDGVAVAAGAWAAKLILPSTLKIIAGIMFLLFGALMLTANDESGKRFHHKNPFLAGFLIISLTEWGDKTQVAAALFSATYNPLMVLAGTMLSLVILSAAAIYVGKRISGAVDQRKMTVAAAAVFILLGLSSLLL